MANMDKNVEILASSFLPALRNPHPLVDAEGQSLASCPANECPLDVVSHQRFCLSLNRGSMGERGNIVRERHDADGYDVWCAAGFPFGAHPSLLSGPPAVSRQHSVPCALR